MKNILILILVITSVLACSDSATIKNLNDSEFKDLMEKTGNKTVLDVRTNGEVAQGALPQAVQIDYNSGNFEMEIDKLDKTKPVFVYCAAGSRSSGAADILATKGFKNIYNLSGGINAWLASGFETQPLNP